MELEFSKNQLKAIGHKDGPMLVLAGPGSGKTAVICARLEKLISDAAADAENILVVTFSKKSALEMKQRFPKPEIKAGKSPVFATFHSIFYAILRQENHTLKCAGANEKYKIIRTALEEAGYAKELDSNLFEQITGEISTIKGNCLDINSFMSESVPGEIFNFVYERYNEMLAAFSLADFDDMLLKCRSLFLTDKRALEKWQQKFTYILIDEFQDINPVQYETIKLLAGKDKNIFIVGDDDQSIYSFRGARPDLMKSFLKDFPGTKTVVLDTNYRSAPEIISACGKVISRNTGRFPKNIRPCAAGEKKRGRVEIQSFEDTAQQEDELVLRIKSLISNGTKPGEIALLFRNNADIAPFSKKLSAAGLIAGPKLKGDGFYSHFICKDICAYLRAALEYPCCGISDILLIMNRPVRYISRRALIYNEDAFLSMAFFYRGNGRMERTVKKFAQDLEFIRTLPPYGAVKYIRNAAGYNDYIKEYASKTGTDEAGLDNIALLLEEDARRFASSRLFLSHIECTLNKGKNPDKKTQTPVPERQRRSEAGKEQPSVMTIHASKGLEWEAVFIPSCIDRLIPGINRTSPKALEEERRILYVGMTRAKKYLNISYVQKYKGLDASYSRFLEPLVRERHLKGY